VMTLKARMMAAMKHMNMGIEVLSLK
jgi:hypothetical protein